jgi:transmembrane sensor
MPKKEQEILYRFISGEFCPDKDLKLLHKWLEEESNRQSIDALLSDEWEKNTEKETAVQFKDIQKKTGSFEPGATQPVLRFLKKTVNSYQKIAAVLLIPLLLFISYYFVSQPENEIQYFQTMTVRGQKSQVILPDGTKVWLNAESMIEYPATFGKKNREVKIAGEAFFEVAEDKSIPFYAKAGNVEVKVTGTSFNLKAYPDESEVETSLMEGEIELKVPQINNTGSSNSLKMKPGDSYVFNTETNKVLKSDFKADEINGWKNNQLIFKDDNFKALAKKIERWYAVEMIYNEEKLSDQRLTVECFEGERLSRVLEIIEIAISVNCKIDGNKIYVESKK